MHYSISDTSGKKIYTNKLEFKKTQGNNSDGQIKIELNVCIPLTGDIKIEFYSKKMRREKLFHFWFNTYFAVEEAEGEFNFLFLFFLIAWHVILLFFFLFY